MIRNPGQLFSPGIRLRLVEKGYADDAVSPIATGNFNPQTHFCHMPPVTFVPGSNTGGYYSWNGTQISFAAWPGAVSPWRTNGGAIWHIFEVENLKGEIVRVLENLNLSGGGGFVNYDKEITSGIGDHEKTMVLPQCMGFAGTPTIYTRSHTEFLLPGVSPNYNPILRRRHYQPGTGAISNVMHSTVLLPLY